MSVTQRLMNLGNWALELTDDAPISADLALADHIVITATPMDPIAAFDDATILDNAIYSGVCTERQPRSFRGYDLSWWMGTPEGVGYYLGAEFGFAGATTLSDVLSVPEATGKSQLTPGVISNAGLTVLTDPIIPAWVTFREIIDAYTSLTGGEWRVNPDGTYDAAAASTLFTLSPTVVVTRRAEGQDGAFRGLDGTLVASEDIESYSPKVYAVVTLTDFATATTASTYLTFGGVAINMQRAFLTTDGNTKSELATAMLAKFDTKRRELKLSSRTYDVTADVDPGDYVYAYDLEADLTDNANQIQYQGEIIAPIKLRVYALTWPIQRGMGVYARHSTGVGTATYIDLTNYVRWEGDDENPGEVQWEVGAAARPFSDDAATVGNIGRLGQNGTVTESAGAPRVGVSVNRSTNQSITNATVTDVSFTTESEDTSGYIAVTATTVTIPAALGGMYAITASVNWASNPGAAAFLNILTASRNHTTNAGTTTGSMGHGIVLPLAGGATVKVQVFQATGGALNVASAFLDVYRIGN